MVKARRFPGGSAILYSRLIYGAFNNRHMSLSTFKNRLTMGPLIDFAQAEGYAHL